MPSESIPIRVAVRGRPLIPDEKGCKAVVKVTPEKVAIEAVGKEQAFSVDHSYGQDSKTSKIYQECCDSLVQRSLNGYNISILAIGATGSGKSHLVAGTEDEPGLVPLVIQGLFRHLGQARSTRKSLVTAAFLEVEGEELRDLLNPHTNPMKIRDHPQLGIYVEGLSELVAHTEEDLARLYEQGSRARKMGCSDMRGHRARANAIFQIRVELKETSGNKVGVKSLITLADLAGIEESRETGGDKGVQNLVRVLSTLKSGGHIPYRDSCVTRILQDSLGGNAVTLLFATLSPADRSCADSIKTLQLVQGVRGHKNKARINLDESQSMVADLRDEIARLRNKLTDKNNLEDAVHMQELVADLARAKKQTWPEKEKLSRQLEEQRKTNLANKGILEWVMDTSRRGDKETQERILLLQKEKDQLTLEYKDKRRSVDDMKEDLQKKINEYSKMAESGKASENDTKKRVAAIHDLKERLKNETEALKDVKRRLKDVQDKQRAEKESSQGQAAVKGNAELRHLVEEEERHRQATENKALIAEELERMRLEVEHGKAEVTVRSSQGQQLTTDETVAMQLELTELRAEKPVVALQIQCLQQEKERLSNDLEATRKRHLEELEIQQLQHFQTFREYRAMFEEQKAVLEQRYRHLMEDAIQDAVFLATRNNELMTENQALKQDCAEHKDKVSLLEGRAAATGTNKK